jgi:hypothetical protein
MILPIEVLREPERHSVKRLGHTFQGCRHKKQMKVIAHQTPGPDLSVSLHQVLPQRRQEELPIF